MVENMLMSSIIYILVIVLLIILIILGIKGIFAIDNINKTIEDVNKKIHSFDGLFDFFESLSCTLDVVNKKFISKIDYALRIFSKFRKEDGNE